MGGVPGRKELICWRILTWKMRTPSLRTKWKRLQSSGRDDERGKWEVYESQG